MTKFAYFMNGDHEMVSIDVKDVVGMLADCFSNDAECETGDTKLDYKMRQHLFAFHHAQLRLRDDVLNRALAHKAVMEYAATRVDVYECISK